MSKFVRTAVSKPVIIAGLASALLFVSACSGEPESAGAPSAESSPSQALETESPTVDPGSNSDYGPTIGGIPTLKELASDQNGVWRKSTIMPDDPAFEIKEDVLASMEPNVREMWTEEEIKEAHRLAINMTVDAIDTPANGALGDTESMEKWWEANKDNFHPEWQETMKASALNTDVNQPVVYKAPHRQHDDPTLDYSLVYGEDKAHIKDRVITTTAVSAGELDGRDAIRVDLEVTFFNVVTIDDKEDYEGVGASIGYTFVKDEATGKLHTTGNSSTFNTQPLR